MVTVEPEHAIWQIAWGRVEALPHHWKQDIGVAIAPGSPLATSPTGRFAVIGNAWIPGCDRPLAWIAEQWEQHGTATWEGLIGTFALAIWDQQREILYLGRDRAGHHTLYYTPNGHPRAASNQLHALNAFRSDDLDAIALRDYLACAFVPGDRTLWRDVRELRPGNTIQFPDSTLTAYWTPTEQIQAIDQPLAWHGDRLRDLLNQVVRASLPAQEPVGVFLSGGLDSSCVTALAAQFHAHPVHTYSIHFGADCPNELEFSSCVAQHCGTQHHCLEISLKTLWHTLPETMAVLDDPIGDPLTVPNLLLGRLARDSVRVVLNGEGGDPCFGGPKNQPMLLHSLYGAAQVTEPLQAYLRSFQKCAPDLPQLLQPDVWQAVQAEPWVFDAEGLSQPAHYLNRLMLLNIKFKGADHILTKVNNLTRAAGILARSPLFDARVVEQSLHIPPDYKLSGVQEKAVLKQAVADLLPDVIIQRPKSGMMVPVQLGFREHWHRPAKALLLDRRAAIAPYLNQSLIRNWLNYEGDTWNRYGVKLWLLASLELWLQHQHRHR